jgi:hypothetical protein
VAFGYRPLQLDLWVPPGAEAPPLLVWVHGGGRMLGDRRYLPETQRPNQLFDALLAAGLAVATIDYSVVMSDYSTAVLGPPVARRLHDQSPDSRLYIYTLSPALVDGAPESMRSHDLIVIPYGFLADMPHQDIYEDDWGCMVSSDNEGVGMR